MLMKGKVSTLKFETLLLFLYLWASVWHSQQTSCTINPLLVFPDGQNALISIKTGFHVCDVEQQTVLSVLHPIRLCLSDDDSSCGTK